MTHPPPMHPWLIAAELADRDYITKADVRNIVMAHENTLRRAIREVRMALPDIAQTEDITPNGIRRIESALLRASIEESPDL